MKGIALLTKESAFDLVMKSRSQPLSAQQAHLLSAVTVTHGQHTNLPGRTQEGGLLVVLETITENN